MPQPEAAAGWVYTPQMPGTPSASRLSQMRAERIVSRELGRHLLGEPAGESACLVDAHQFLEFVLVLGREFERLLEEEEAIERRMHDSHETPKLRGED